MKHYLQFTDLDAQEYAHLFSRAALIKAKFKAYEKHQPLTDRTLAMIFEKASTRTRVSFEAGMYQLGGSVVHLTTGDSQLGRAEPIEDSARVISRMVDLVMIRTFGQDKIERFAQHSRVPVINGLTNEFHPCQILADLFTFIEHRGDVKDPLACLRGKVVGRIHARKVMLTATSRVEGDILHEAFAVESGAFFEGNIRHSDNPLGDENLRLTPAAKPAQPGVQAAVKTAFDEVRTGLAGLTPVNQPAE